MLNLLSSRTLSVAGVGASAPSCALECSSTDVAVYTTPVLACVAAWVDHMPKARINALRDHRSLRSRRGMSDALVLKGGGARVFARHGQATS